MHYHPKRVIGWSNHFQEVVYQIYWTWGNPWVFRASNSRTQPSCSSIEGLSFWDAVAKKTLNNPEVSQFNPYICLYIYIYLKPRRYKILHINQSQLFFHRLLSWRFDTWRYKVPCGEKMRISSVYFFLRDQIEYLFVRFLVTPTSMSFCGYIYIYV